jgi:hypothetical protein
MILYKEDWNRYPGAIVDEETTNKSWVELAHKLHYMNIENNCFFLALHNPELQGVDPFSSKLTHKQKMAIGLECKVNPWYYLREIARAPSNAGGEPFIVEANRANISVWWCFFNHIFYFLTQPRQTGKSFNVDLLMTWLMNFGTQNTTINLLTNGEKTRAANIQRLKNIYELLPPYLNFKTRLDANNTEELSIKKFKNWYKTHLPQMSPKAANNTGRGLTSPILHVDESPFQANIDISYKAAAAGLGAARDQAKATGEPYGQLFTSTAGRLDDPSGKYIYESIIMNCAIWNEIYYDSINQKDLEDRIKANSPSGHCRIYGAFNHRQLGKSDEWLKIQIQESGQDEDAANRDFLNIWTRGSTANPLPTWQLESMISSKKDIVYSKAFRGYKYIMNWYISEKELLEGIQNRKFIAGLDTSEGTGKDDIALVIIDVETGAVISSSVFNETNLVTFSQWLTEVIAWLSNTTFIIERKSSGVYIIDYLLLMLPAREIDPFTRLFNWITADLYTPQCREYIDELKKPVNRRNKDIYERLKDKFGYATAGSGRQSRDLLYSNVLVNTMNMLHNRIHDSRLIDQINGLVIKNGRMDHAAGSHDDCVIAWLLAHWFLSLSTNLQHYGIDRMKVYAGTVEVKKDVSPMDLYINDEQDNIRKEIQDIYEKMKNTYDSFINTMLEHKLRVLSNKLILRHNEFYSLDAVLESIKNDKTNKYRNR